MPRSVFQSDLTILALRGRPASLSATLRVTGALRGLLMRECPEQPPPEWFSGHTQDGKPTKGPHLGLTPLPFVDAERADGRIIGLAVILPRHLGPEDAGSCLEPILRDLDTGSPRKHRLFAGRWLDCEIALDTREDPPWNLNPTAWTGGEHGSRVWASVTPVVLNRHYNGPNRWERAAEGVKTACEHIGLPRPREVRLHPTPVVHGVPPADKFAQVTRKTDGGRCGHSHSLVTFDQPIRGPVVLGAGRFRGYGLCRPIDDKVKRRGEG
ncbi:type I-U CRISPR-associated protein Csb2 [Candidatus Palauibacter sp.]|uniref:type I-G CRISPR-associated protein Csb2 n=1 Tax=Candidatus Palauibacter sp. TaxID=3101350 RepID=UPI003AF2004F